MLGMSEKEEGFEPPTHTSWLRLLGKLGVEDEDTLVGNFDSFGEGDCAALEIDGHLFCGICLQIVCDRPYVTFERLFDVGGHGETFFLRSCAKHLMHRLTDAKGHYFGFTHTAENK